MSAIEIVKTIALFVFAALLEIGGGWMVWQFIRVHRPWYFLVFGLISCALYGLVPTLQSESSTGSFGRTFAVYGGFFIIMALLWDRLVDGKRPDTGDYVGAAIAWCGVLLMLYWPRSSNQSQPDDIIIANNTSIISSNQTTGESPSVSIVRFHY